MDGEAAMSLRFQRPATGFTLWAEMEVQPHAQSAFPEKDMEAPPLPQQQQFNVDMEPPRLPSGSGCSRILLVFLCVACLSLVLWGAAAVAFLPLLQNAQAAEPVSPLVRVPVDVARPLPSILARFATLKKVPPPAKGASRDSILAAFPHWADETAPLQWNHDAALRDLALAIGALVERAQPPRQPSPPVPVGTELQNAPAAEVAIVESEL